MKHLKPSFLLILIASALLLSAANAEEPSPRPTAPHNAEHTPHTNSEAAYHQNWTAQPSPSPPATKKIAEHAPTEQKDNRTKELTGNDGGKPWSIWLQVLSDFCIAAATIAIAVLTGQLVKITGDFPYIVFESFELVGFWPEHTKLPVTCRFVLKNHGKGVAVSLTVRARLDIVEIDMPKPVGAPKTPEKMRYPVLGDYSRCKPYIIREQALPPGEPSSECEVPLGGDWFNRSTSFLSKETFAALDIPWSEKTGPDIQIVFHVVVRYCDIIDNAYQIEAICDYMSSHQPNAPGYFIQRFVEQQRRIPSYRIWCQKLRYRFHRAGQRASG